MELGHIERGAKLSVFEQIDDHAVSEEYDVVFTYLESDRFFTIHCNRISDRFDELSQNAKLVFSFRVGPFIHTFSGQAKEKKRGGMVLIEQLSDITTFNRRQFDRDEIRVPVKVYNLSKEHLSAGMFKPVEERLIMSDMTFDISAGGFCIITNITLNPNNDPYYLATFSLSDRDLFSLPSEIVRRSVYQRTKIGRYDYGFRFVFEAAPEEKDRLMKAIVNRKLTVLKM